MIHIFAYNTQIGLRAEISLEELPFHLEKVGTLVWVDLEKPTKEEETLLQSAFEFHPLCIENCVKGSQRPRAIPFEEYCFLVAHELSSDRKRLDFQARELFLFTGKEFLVTYHRYALGSVTRTRGDVMQNPKILSEGIDYLLHYILDDIVDGYGMILGEFEVAIADVEKAVTSGLSQTTVVTNILQIRKSLVHLKRAASQQAELFIRLGRGEFSQISPTIQLYCRDLIDQNIRVRDLTDSYLELASSLLETHRSQVTQKTNEVIKVLTMLSTVFLPLTLVTGIYGMNFKFMPELNWKYGYWVVWGVMIALAAVMRFVFKQKKWI